MIQIGQTAVACYHYLILNSRACKHSSNASGESMQLRLFIQFFLLVSHCFPLFWQRLMFLGLTQQIHDGCQAIVRMLLFQDNCYDDAYSMKSRFESFLMSGLRAQDALVAFSFRIHSQTSFVTNLDVSAPLVSIHIAHSFELSIRLYTALAVPALVWAIGIALYSLPCSIPHHGFHLTHWHLLSVMSLLQ